MNIEDLQEELETILPDGFTIDTDHNGELIIRTGLRQEDDGELVPFDGDEDEDDEEDEEFDPDLEPLGDEDDDDE